MSAYNSPLGNKPSLMTIHLPWSWHNLNLLFILTVSFVLLCGFSAPLSPDCYEVSVCGLLFFLLFTVAFHIHVWVHIIYHLFILYQTSQISFIAKKNPKNVLKFCRIETHKGNISLTGLLRSRSSVMCLSCLGGRRSYCWILDKRSLDWWGMIYMACLASFTPTDFLCH